MCRVSREKTDRQPRLNALHLLHAHLPLPLPPLRSPTTTLESMSSLSAQLHNEAADSLPRAAPSEEAASDASSASSDHEDTSDLAPSHILDGSVSQTAASRFVAIRN